MTFVLLLVVVCLGVPCVTIGLPLSVLYMKERIRRQNIALQHQRRLERLSRAEDVIQLLIADKELGGAAYKALEEQFGPRLLPPAPSVTVTAKVGRAVKKAVRAKTTRGRR